MNNIEHTQNQQTSDTVSAETLNALNRINTAAAAQNKNALNTAAGILFLISALSHLIQSFTRIFFLFQELGSWYATFTSIFPNILMFAGHLAAAAGFSLIGLHFFIKNEKMQQLSKYAPLPVIGYFAAAALTQLVYFISWQNGNLLLWFFLNIVYGLFWALIGMLSFGIRPDITEKLSQGYIIIPAVLLAVSLMASVTGYNFTAIAFNITEHAALIILGILIYTSSNKTGENVMNEYSKCASTENSTAYSQTPPMNVTPEPEGFLSIVKLIVLGIVTLGIYLYIWIYRTNEFISKRTPMALTSSSGLQVVLCLFVPFYILYWIYKQCKAIEDYKIRMTGKGGEDLALICLLLSIFGFSIVAYALMQDQINKIVKPLEASAYNHSCTDTYAQAEENAPSQAAEPDAAAVTDAQIETVKKLKALLDAGILTQEEFDAKKKQVLGL